MKGLPLCGEVRKAGAIRELTDASTVSVDMLVDGQKLKNGNVVTSHISFPCHNPYEPVGSGGDLWYGGTALVTPSWQRRRKRGGPDYS